ncbi:PepSY-associated TM helix domain-containing protein [Xanthobacter pseudotagetidis]|uniref:PepSY-associated TM helix domain-containing protein n=1 Tax=Xanthobacter pseudotagetidis TaxID=3119911 RepID=UPI0037263F05
MDVHPDPPSRRRPTLSPAFVRSMLAGHSALGIAFAALIYVVCLTGSVAVFINEFQRWEQPQAPVVAPGVAPESAAAALVEGHAKAVAEGAAHDVFLQGPTATNARLAVFYRGEEDGAEGQWLADSQGRLIARFDAPWSHFLGELHASFHLPGTWGRFLVGVVGVTLLSSLISGLLSHPRIFKDAFALRWGGARQLQEADLHNRLGVWGLPFHVVVSASGALLGLSTLIVGVLALAAYEGDSEKAFAAILGPMPTEDHSPAPLPDLAAMIRHVQAERPQAQFVSATVQHVGTAGQVVHLGMRTPGHLALANTYYFDGDGTPMGDGGLEVGSIGQQILGALQPLHFGWFGGMPVKLGYGLLGLALTYVAYNGVTIWLARRRAKGRPTPGWEKVWAALGWGQPLALATSAAGALLAGESAVIPAYLVATLGAFAYAYAARGSADTGRGLRLATAFVLAFVATVHSALSGGNASDPMGNYIDIALFAAAILLALPHIRRRLAPFRGEGPSSRT